MTALDTFCSPDIGTLVAIFLRKEINDRSNEIRIKTNRTPIITGNGKYFAVAVSIKPKAINNSIWTNRLFTQKFNSYFLMKKKN